MNLESNRTITLVLRAGVLVAFAAGIASAAYGCDDVGGKEGDRCNPLVLRDECDPGLACKAATCSESYCCPTDRTSSDPNCNAAGCPEEEGDAAADAGDASDAAPDATTDSGSDAPAETGLDAADAGDAPSD